MSLFTFFALQNAVSVLGKQFGYQKYQHLNPKNTLYKQLCHSADHRKAARGFVPAATPPPSTPERVFQKESMSNVQDGPPDPTGFVPFRHWEAGNVAPWWRSLFFSFSFF